MGQAKRRGSFEERREQSIKAEALRMAEADIKWHQEQEERRIAANAKWDAMTEEEQREGIAQKRYQQQRGMPIMAMLPLLALVAGGGMIPNIRARR
jgi:hypothetical protein